MVTHNFLDFNRLGIIVSKRNCGNAVKRNYYKRIIREFYRNNRCVICKGFDCIVIQKKTTDKYSDLKIDFLKIFSKIDDYKQSSCKFN